MTVPLPREREQWRAKLAQEFTRNASRTYVTRARGLPVMIHRLGLAGTIAFLCSHKDQLMADHLATWLLGSHSGMPVPAEFAGKTKAAKLQALLSHESTDVFTYRLYSAEAIRFANWLKRWSVSEAEARSQGTEPTIVTGVEGNG